MIISQPPRGYGIIALKCKVKHIFKKFFSPESSCRILILTGGERCACELLEQLQITQPTLSHHMKTLEDCGLVSTRRKGKWSHYSLNSDQWTAFRDYIESIRIAGERKDESGCCS